MKKKIFLNVIILMLLTSCNSTAEPIVTPELVDTNVLYKWDFEGTDSLHHLSIEDASALKNSVSMEIDPLNPANKVLKTVLLKGNDRTELSLYTSNLSRIVYYYADAAKGFTDKANTIKDGTSLGNELWMSIKILKPQEQNTNGLKPSIFQLGPVSNGTLKPPVSSSGFCQVRVRNGTTPTGDSWNWRVFGSYVYTPDVLNRDFNFVTKPYDVWEKFVVHCRYSTGPDGILEVWKDGVKYISTVGPNAIPFNRFRIKWGIYIGMGNKAGQDLTCYFDDVIIYSGNVTYEDVK